jgi:hypothetical protein
MRLSKVIAYGGKGKNSSTSTVVAVIEAVNKLEAAR